jgi:predicted short-subunit dehydrogenase-like oxidoreductase (DUF2520 family)
MLRISIIGSGNVATHLGLALKPKGIEIVEIWSRDGNKAEELANKIGATRAEFIRTMKMVDLMIIAVADDAITAASHFLEENQLAAHTSGSISLEALGPGRRGVFYPLQTFSKDKQVDFSHVPICLEARESKDEETLKTIADLISDKAQFVSSDQRKHIHLAAVFACNFTNQMYTIAEDILQSQDLELDILHPLIQETTDKIMKISPRQAQTGPARRGDMHVLNSHLDLLNSNPDLRSIYGDLSEQILKNNDNV